MLYDADDDDADDADDYDYEGGKDENDYEQSLSIHSNAEDTKSAVENDKDDADGNIAAATIKFLLDDDADDERCNLLSGGCLIAGRFGSVMAPLNGCCIVEF